MLTESKMVKRVVGALREFVAIWPSELKIRMWGNVEMVQVAVEKKTPPTKLVRNALLTCPSAQ